MFKKKIKKKKNTSYLDLHYCKKNYLDAQIFFEKQNQKLYNILSTIIWWWETWILSNNYHETLLIILNNPKEMYVKFCASIYLIIRINVYTSIY